MPLPSLAELVAQSGASAPAFFTKDSKVGDSITGFITGVETRQARDPKDNKPRHWENGDPAIQVVISIQTELKDDEDDDGIRSVFVKWWGVQRKSLLEALTEAKQEDLAEGQEFTATLTGVEKAKTKAMSDTKLYSYRIA